MTVSDLYRLLLKPLHGSGIDYMITGSVAAIAYGEPRMTNDVDLVVRLGPTGPDLLRRAYPAADYYVPPIEVMQEERMRPQFGHFNIIHHDSALRADIYLASNDPLHAWALSKRHSEQMADGSVWFAPIEYVIVRKLEYFRQAGSDRHLRDIAGIVRISGEEIDMSTLSRLLTERGLTEVWERARTS